MAPQTIFHLRFLSVKQRKMSIIFRGQGVTTYLVPINIQQYGAEKENNGAFNLCLVLHNVCLLVQSVLYDYKKKSIKPEQHADHTVPVVSLV